MNTSSKLKITIQIIFAIIFGLSLFAVLIQVYGFFFFDHSFFKKEILILKDSALDPSMNFFDIIKSFWSLIRQQDREMFPVSVTMMVSVVISMYVVFTDKKEEKGPNNTKVTRGPTLLDFKDLNKDFKKFINQETNEIYKDLPAEEKKNFSKKKFKEKLEGTAFSCSSIDCEVRIPDYILQRHLAFIGTTGAGKTTEIKHYIDHVNSLNEKSIIIDLNGEIYSEMGREEDVIISPFDSRSYKWDFSHEKSKGHSISSSEYAKYIVPKGSEQSSFWWKGARTVFSELLDHYPSALELWGAITDSDRGFRDKLSGVVNNIIGTSGSSQDAGIIGTLSSDLNFLRHLISLNAESSKNYFSISKWAQDTTTRNVYIVFSDKDLESISPLVRIWLNLAVLGRFDAGKDNNLPKMNIIVDEIGSLGRLEKLPDAIARLRKYGGKVILGLQSEGQLSSTYGTEDAKAIKGNIGTRFIFRTPEEDEAKNLSKFLGRSEVISVSQNVNTDAKGNSHSSKSESTSYKDIVLDSEIRELPDGHFYLKSLNLSPAKLRIKKKKWPQIHDLHQNFVFKNSLIKSHQEESVLKEKREIKRKIETIIPRKPRDKAPSRY